MSGQAKHADDEDNGAPPLATYAHKPKPIGYEVSFRLGELTLAVDSMRKVDTIWLGAISSIRLMYAPTNFARRGYKTTIRVTDGRSVSFSNISWQGLSSVAQQDDEYSQFVSSLVASVSAANPDVKLIAGRRQIPWLLLVVFTATALIGMGAFAWRAVTLGQTNAAILAGLILAAAIWQMEPFVRLNRPRTFRPDDLPKDLLP